MTRRESDSLGTREIPDDRYYGVQTARAMDNFPISHIPLSRYPYIIKALGAIKEAAAVTNFEQGILSPKVAKAIIKAAREVQKGQWNGHFPMDVIQGGAGTSANMNANEVICNRALEIMGHKKGQFDKCHPLNQVNMSQSTNDVYPTAAKLAIIWSCQDLIPAIEALAKSFLGRAAAFKKVIKMGRTQLQDAVPMTLGQEFAAFGHALLFDLQRIKEAVRACYVINMGATAIGTGINTLPAYAKRVCEHLAKITKLPLVKAKDLVEATSDVSPFVSISGTLKGIAVTLTKTCNDLRLLSSGPFTGFHDISLPAMAPGSTIMPGKVNPVIPEVVNQVCFLVIGNDTTVVLAASAGQLQLNAFEPIMFYRLSESIEALKNACDTLRINCVDTITANSELCRQHVLKSAGLITAFSPYIGYEASAKIAKEVQKGLGTVYERVKASGLLKEKDIDKIISPEFMTSPHPLLNIKRNQH